MSASGSAATYADDRGDKRVAGGRAVLLDHGHLVDRLRQKGIGQPRQSICRTPREALAAAVDLCDPLVLKLVSPRLMHKSDVGGVRLNLRGPDQVLAAAEQLTELAATLELPRDEWQILVQEMITTPELEVFVGAKRDPVFGPVVIVGAGGRLVELMPAVSIRACPISTASARDMLAQLPVGAMLAGYRGGPDAVEIVAELISRTSSLLDDMPDVEEIDLNPVLVVGNRALAVDARAVTAGCSARSAVRSAAEVPDLSNLLEARSVLVVGASSSGAAMPGNNVLKYLRKFSYPGKVFVVHPSADEIAGFPCNGRISDLAGESIDLVCVGVSADKSIDVVEQCGKIGVPAAIIFGSGFSEIGNSALEAELAGTAARYDMALCGPNTVGIISPADHLHACFSQCQSADVAVAGNCALIAQSGALGGSLISQAWERGIGVSRFISVGNQVQLGTVDYLEYLVHDPQTTTVAVLLEGVLDGLALVRAVQRLRAAGKSTVLLKVGRGMAGARAVESHTGSIAGDYDVFRAVMHQAGAIQVDSISDMLDVLTLYSSSLHPVSGSRMAVLSTSGGACGLVADLCERHGFELATFSEKLRARLGDILPGFAATANPVDVTGQVTSQPALYGQALEVVLRSPDIDLVTIMLTTIAEPQAGRIATEIVRQIVGQDKPVLVCWTIAPNLAPNGFAILERAGIPVFDDPARAIRAASAVRR